MVKRVREAVGVLNMAVMTATTGVYCWQHLLAMADKMVVGGGLVICSLMMTILAIMLMAEAKMAAPDKLFRRV